MPQRILNRNEIRLLTGIVQNHCLSFSSNEKDKVLKSLQGKIKDLFSYGENDQVTVSVAKCE